MKIFSRTRWFKIVDTSAYQHVTICKANTAKKLLALLEGIINVYLPELKYMSGDLSQKCANAANYFAYASEAIKEMVR